MDFPKEESQELDPRATAALDKALSAFFDELSAQWQMPAPESIDPIRTLTNWLVKYDRWQPHITWLELFEIVSNAFDNYPETRVQEPRKLKELLSRDSFDQAFQSLRSYLLAFPREYDLWIELPQMPCWGAGEIPISRNLSIVEGVAPAKIPEAIVEPSFRVYLCIRTKGYGSSRIETTAVTAALSSTKQFLQLFRHQKVFKEASGLINVAMAQPAKCVLHDLGAPNAVTNIRLPSTISGFLATASLNETALRVFEPGLRILLDGTFREAQTREEKVRAFRDATTTISKVMETRVEKRLDTQRIRTALEWNFDADHADNQTLSFIQACIGLEALLGDDAEDEPLVGRLADRAAYLLGQTEEDRKQIRKSFRAFYAVRSKVVHGRSARLRPSDVTQLHAALAMLRDVINEEAARMLRAIKESEAKPK